MRQEPSISIKGRMYAIFGVILLIPCAIILQLFRINFEQGPELRKLWSRQAIDYIPIPAQRGNIYDENGTLLVTNSVAYKIAIDPGLENLTQDQIEEICGIISKHNSLRASKCLRKIQNAPKRSRYIILARNATSETYDALQQLDNPALILDERYKRRYNFNSMAAHMLGYVNHGMQGITGLEKFYDAELKGEDGIQQVRRDRNGEIFEYIGAPRKQPRQGYSLHTTIDSHIQAIVEEELIAGIERTKSSYGSAIVMDPQTGAIKAMANYPSFNPNNPASLNSKNRRNFAISDIIEPGSTFKLVTAIAAVEQNKVQFEETFRTPEDGTTQIHGQWMRDHVPLGELTFPEVIYKSSNIATAEIAMRLDNDKFYQYARNLGFGTTTNIDLPNEEHGRLRKPYEWSKVTLPWMSIGYGMQATPLQLTQAYAAFANEGLLMRPYVVEKITDAQGNTVKVNRKTAVRQIANKETIKKLYPVFQKVVSDSGTAKFAQVEGLSIAGKTGTAQRYIDGSYQNEYSSSFVGFFPLDKPKYVSLIVLNNPRVYPPYGGVTAGPIFRETAKRIAGLDNEIEKQIIEHGTSSDSWAYAPKLKGLNLTEAKTLLDQQLLAYNISGTGDYVAEQKPTPGTRLSPEETIEVILKEFDTDDNEDHNEYATVPDVKGLSMRKAVSVINSQGYRVDLNGSGTVQAQFPEAGERMKKSGTVTIRGKATSLKTLAQKN